MFSTQIIPALSARIIIISFGICCYNNSSFTTIEQNNQSEVFTSQIFISFKNS